MKELAEWKLWQIHRVARKPVLFGSKDRPVPQAAESTKVAASPRPRPYDPVRDCQQWCCGFCSPCGEAGNQTHLDQNWAGWKFSRCRFKRKWFGDFEKFGFLPAADDYCFVICTNLIFEMFKIRFWESLDEPRSSQMTCNGDADINAPPDASLDRANTQSRWHHEPVGNDSNLMTNRAIISRGWYRLK